MHKLRFLLEPLFPCTLFSEIFIVSNVLSPTVKSLSLFQQTVSKYVRNDTKLDTKRMKLRVFTS